VVSSSSGVRGRMEMVDPFSQFKRKQALPPRAFVTPMTGLNPVIELFSQGKV